MKEYRPGADAPIEKRLSLRASPERAFAHFTENIGAWWPLATHSLSQGGARMVTFEAKAGGRIFETDAAGREREWGRVLEIAPPHRIVFSWVLENPVDATEVEVMFAADGKGGTDFTLVHRGWFERKSAGGRRALYEGGWDGVLAGYARTLS
jgi:uncharacterized protein YndB with AHSA1/START domain